MADLFEYFPWRGDLSMTAAPFCDVDRLILSELAYIDFDADTPQPLPDLCQKVLSKIEGKSNAEKKKILHLKQDEQLLRELSTCKRFKNCLIGSCVSQFDPEIEQQFAAMTVILPDETAACVYRGTDWSLIGWKEDINMAYCDVLPSQQSAVHYLRQAMERYETKFRVMGHSKGGNLAIFASAFCGEPLQDRILEVTSLDGPGFGELVIRSDGYKNIADRVRTVLPKSSIVGALFTNTGKFAVIESKSSPIMQHIPYTWEILGPNFVTVAERDGTSQLIGTAFNDWIRGLEPERRKLFIDTVWSLLADTEIYDLDDLLNGRNTLTVIKNYNALDESSKRMIGETLGKLRESVKESFGELIEQSKKSQA
ncbi:MAG: DUF2974 domain-containing protein [Ruminococcaceae bacterium]|nr:DUF2974 domain-containing protein [Oscillospiraceae bacterium]